MLKTKFNKEEMNVLCGLLKQHGTDCSTLVDILGLAHRAYPNDAMNTYKHVILLKELGVMTDRDLLCHTCIHEIVEHHANTCEEYKERMREKYFFPCPDDHYDYSKANTAVWMVDGRKIRNLEKEAAYKAWKEGNTEHISSWCEQRDGREVVVRGFDYTGRSEWLQRMFPDIMSDIRFNLWMGFLCDEHIGSMKPHANKITGYR